MAEGRGQATCDREHHPDRPSIAVVSSAHPPRSRPGLQDARQRHRDASRALRSIEALTRPQDAVDDMVAEFQARRGRIADGLDRLPGLR
jgi:hypothetical protein